VHHEPDHRAHHRSHRREHRLRHLETSRRGEPGSLPPSLKGEAGAGSNRQPEERVSLAMPRLFRSDLPASAARR
jgi:hypothetical protein